MKHRSAINLLFCLLTSALSCLGCCDEARIPDALRGIYSQEPRTKTESLQILAQCGTESESAVRRIASLMYDSNVGVASAAAYALRKIDSHEARQALLNAEAARKKQRK